ncbi:MAG: SsrA-binding protein SmpB [Proteobacteria bacterium]|nr:MAG: SsrA-binding protein SmpB [Pseudomonadota bacterium]
MSGKKPEVEKLIASNPARGDYFVETTVEAGISLTGTEVKSLRQSSPNLRDSFVDIHPKSTTRLEAWLLNMHIAPYTHGNLQNHEPLRKRKLLLHRHQIDQLHGSLVRDGMTVIPLRFYFKAGKVKCELGVCKGKKREDKRQDVKKKSADREIERVMKSSRRFGKGTK